MDFVLQRPDELLENKSKSSSLEISLYCVECRGVVGSSELASYPGNLGPLLVTSPHFLLFPSLHPCESWQITIQYSKQVFFIFFFSTHCSQSSHLTPQNLSQSINLDKLRNHEVFLNIEYTEHHISVQLLLHIWNFWFTVFGSEAGYNDLKIFVISRSPFRKLPVNLVPHNRLQRLSCPYLFLICNRLLFSWNTFIKQ
jgi:hypothetical protein